MSKIDSEIEQMAAKMEKSVQDPKQLLFNTVMEMGPEGLKKAAENLSEKDRELLKSFLGEFAKGKEDMTPKKDETKAAEMKQESQSGSDDEDEKLMNEKNAEHPHQGGPKDKPEGWEGEVIKSEDKAAVKKLIQIEEAEHKKDIDGDGKVAENMKEKCMKKSLEEIVEMAKSLNLTKEDVVKSIKDANEDLELVKGKMKEMMEAKQASKEEPKKDEPKKDEDKKEMPKMEKSIVWQPKSSIAANTLGRNTHWDVDAYIEKSEAEKQDTIKKGAYFNDTQGESLQKSNAEKADINDLIEKGMDYSTEEISRLEGIRGHKVEGKVVKSFHDIDIAKAMGMSEEDYKKLMGE